jgi:hypothetical protein
MQASTLIVLHMVSVGVTSIMKPIGLPESGSHEPDGKLCSRRWALAAKSAPVTGGGRGIGAAIARALSTAGARVALVGRTEAALTKTSSDPIHHQPRCLALPHAYTCLTCGDKTRKASL